MKYNVTAVSLNRRTRQQIAPTRVELIDTETNSLLAHARKAYEVEWRYEAMWNDWNPHSAEIVKVIGVEDAAADPVGTHPRRSRAKRMMQ